MVHYLLDNELTVIMSGLFCIQFVCLYWQAETESKLGGRGDSAVSKGTTDSGVVMEHRNILVLPGAVPSKLSPLTSESIRETEVERNTQDGEYVFQMC